ncbi:MAG: heme-binding protein [Granulosicoccus sp.]|nr:heme-binding protein [Granulosicoccus sp.]
MKNTLKAIVCTVGVVWAGTGWAIDAPTDLVVVVDSATNSAQLSWSPIADATGYNVYRDDGYIDTVPAPLTNYIDTTAGQSYYLTAFNSNVDPIDISPKGNVAQAGSGGSPSGCAALPTHSALTDALRSSVAPTGGPANGGFDLNMWGAVVDRDGIVCAIARTGNDKGDQWPGSRVISAQKANTANAFSLPGLALSTANLWAATQPGGSLFGLQFSNPVDTAVAYGDPSHNGGSGANYGTAQDPMVGEFIGGVNVFGGGLGLYNDQGELIGGIGVSGDTSCADHNIAWRTRAELALDYVPGGVGAIDRPDNINYQGDAANSALQEDFSHPVCAIAGTDNVSSVSAALPVVRVLP